MKCLEKYPYTERTLRYLYFFLGGGGERGLSEFGHFKFSFVFRVYLCTKKWQLPGENDESHTVLVKVGQYLGRHYKQARGKHVLRANSFCKGHY